MKLLFVCNEYPPVAHGGIGTFVYTLAHRLVEQSHDVIVVGYDPSIEKNGWQDDGGVWVYRIASPYSSMKRIQVSHYQLNPAFILERMFLSSKVNKLVEMKNIDLVESYDWSGPLWMHPSRPLVVRLHGANTVHAVYEHKKPSHLLRFIEGRNLHLDNHLVAVSRHIGELTMQTFDMKGTNYTVINNGVDMDAFTPGLAVNRELGLILYAGSIHPRKGLIELFDAMAIVFKNFPLVRLILAGRLPADDGSLQEKLMQIIPEGIRSSVHFLGYVPYHQMPDLYNRATLAVFPSLSEAFGLTCAEAMACGTPVVMTSRASGPEIVEHEISGLLADPTHPEELAGAILRLLADAKLRNSISCNAVMRIREKFALPIMLQQNVSYYQNLII